MFPADLYRACQRSAVLIRLLPWRASTYTMYISISFLPTYIYSDTVLPARLRSWLCHMLSGLMWLLTIITLPTRDRVNDIEDDGLDLLFNVFVIFTSRRTYPCYTARSLIGQPSECCRSVRLWEGITVLLGP